MPQPLPFRHSVFGAFVYKDDLDWYEVHLMDGLMVALMADEGVPAASDMLDRFAAERESLTSGAADHATAALYQPKMDAWLDEDEDEMTPEIFRSRLSLRSIVAHADGLEFSFDDGDLFWGHSIQVWMDASGEFSDAHIAG